jgi:quercetin dioxygenase-like cupin family protein
MMSRMSIVDRYRLTAMVGDPDDHRPASQWFPLADPGDAAGRVETLAVIVEEIGPGDRIPLHRHDVDEVVFVRGEGGFYTLDATSRPVAAGAIVFIPAGAAHGLRNAGRGPLPIVAVFPSTVVVMEMLERNPAPGSEGALPAPPLLFDLRTGSTRPA